MALDFNHRPKPANFSDEFEAVIDEAMQEANAKETRRDYLGGSRLGEECARQLQYEYRGAKRKPFPGRILRVFERGHDSEARMIERFRTAGFEIITRAKHGGQLGFATAKDRIKGHYDGVITSAPIDLATPCIWEHKCVGAKAFALLKKNGLRKARPVYAGQVATYQAYSELTDNPALFTAENADTGELYAERVPFDAKLAQECTDRGVAVLQAEDAGELLPRPYASSDFFKCRFCDFNEECWNG